jgi:class 3 adenylate cyclase
MSKILVVDDEQDLEILIKQKLRRQIREGQYEFVFAYDGMEALQLVNSDPSIHTILSDINMPRLDGLGLLLKLQEINPLIKTVIISAYGDMDNIRTAMNRGAFDFLCKPINFEDLEITIAKTQTYVSQLQNTVKAIRENNILKMYVDPSVLQYMTREEFAQDVTVNETLDASVAFIDICGFTAIAENEAPDLVVKLLNKYFDLIVTEITQYGGYVDKFMGDAVMAVFKGDLHADNAVEASLAVLRQITNIQEASVSFQPNVSIGINSGEMVSGNIGSVSLKRLDYTVIGDIVNTAQRIQSHANPGEVLVGENTYERIQQTFVCQRKEDAVVKNKHKPIKIFQVVE